MIIMLRTIQTPEEYKSALARVEELRARSLPEEAEELELLLKLIRYYEKGIVFLTEGKTYVNNFYLDWTGGEKLQK
jgi:hypothetical protein